MRIATLGLIGVLSLTAFGVFAQDCPPQGSGTHNDPKQTSLNKTINCP